MKIIRKYKKNGNIRKEDFSTMIIEIIEYYKQKLYIPEINTEKPPSNNN